MGKSVDKRYAVGEWGGSRIQWGGCLGLQWFGGTVLCSCPTNSVGLLVLVSCECCTMTRVVLGVYLPYSKRTLNTNACAVFVPILLDESELDRIVYTFTSQLTTVVHSKLDVTDSYAMIWPNVRNCFDIANSPLQPTNSAVVKRGFRCTINGCYSFCKL